jgi:hypothetical protein
MSTFNTTRFGQALKCQFLVLRKTWIRLFGIFTLVMFMADLFFTRVQGVEYDDMASQWSVEEFLHTYGNCVGQTAGFGVIFFCFSMLFGASFLFSGMKDTRKRSAFLLWPVSNLEKYIISLLLSILWLAVITIGAYLLADTLRVFIDWVTGRVVIWGLPRMFTGIFGPGGFEHWQMAWMFLAWVFYIHSLYILGGTLFRRQQFLFTSGTIVVVGILLVMLLNQIDYWTVFHFEFITGTWDEKTQTYTQIFHPLFYIINSAMMLLIVFHYWVSYKLFTRMQVINNKWLNV